ncbi:gamma-glutamyl-gamma-aminobutyrate hydrolase family protein [Amorphus orientalis]|uniref:gamma-glutamyl-gamma-aminobutyrate hydrolase n=1 Tax=Amorphus orientalis TaxID=649198 RepID=A0AAE3VRZ9_9HYPH|nr:gamma-glutamyl-gamma-aminobutyrate hydrolase family protein [Amorphus orientalis]MDQ0316581.1 putative glutamine amidotransferase [Amorphus orientalis]
MSKPLILVTSDQRSFDNFVWSATQTQYLEAVSTVAGGVPVQVPAIDRPVDVETLLDRADGLFVTGSRSNVHPSRYGGSATEEAEPYDLARDQVTLPLIRGALARGLPLLAVCRGLQELNVALGGTLHPALHSLSGRFDHRSPDSTDNKVRFKLSHQVDVVPGSQLAEIVGETTFMVNSLHRQGIFTLADGLVVEATAPDGTIEAVRVADARGFAVAVQWHPEFWAETDPPSRRIFEAFGAAARRFRETEIAVPVAG